MPKLRPVMSLVPNSMYIAKFRQLSGISLPTARRYWFGTSNGRHDGDAMTLVHLPTLHRVATALGLPWQSLLEESNEDAS